MGEANSQSAQHQADPVDLHDLDADRTADPVAHELRQHDLPDSPYKRNTRPDFLAHGKPPNSFETGSSARNALNRPEIDPEDDDDIEYVPPEPADVYSSTGHADRSPQISRHNRHQADVQPEHPQPRRRYEFPAGGTRIVRNHITSPMAPQASRISVLALAKDPLISQGTRGRQHADFNSARSENITRRESPEPNSSTHSRKKRKLLDKKTRKRAGSHDAAVKDEPISPPPFHKAQPLGNGGNGDPRGIVERPIYVDEDPPPVPRREVRYVPLRPDSTSNIVYEHELRAPQTEPRTYSRASARPMPETDLRRVASMQNMRLVAPIPEQETIYQTPVRTSRAPSYTVIESPRQQERIQSYSQAPGNVHSSPYPQPELHYRPSDPISATSRRIVIDGHGRELYELSDQPTIPRNSPALRQPASDTFHSGLTYQNSNARAVSVFEEPRREVRYVQEMPPPSQPSYRRLANTSEDAFLEPPLPAGVDNLQYMQRRPSSHVINTRPPQPLYVENQESRHMLRMESVRPDGRPAMAYYEIPQDSIPQRDQSLRPQIRQMSVVMDDRHVGYVQVAREPHEVNGNPSAPQYHRY